MNCESLFSEIFPFWDTLTPDEKHSVCSSTREARYSRGTVVHDGASCPGLTIVRSGCLRASVISEEGREVTLYRLHDAEFCMLSASCVIEAISFDVHFIAEEDSECLVLSAGVLGEICGRHPAAEIFALNKTVERFSDVMWVLQQILFLSLDRRLAGFLYDESVRQKTDELSFTHEDIARNIASAREAVSRLLKYFEGEGLVSLARGKVLLLDRARLRALAAS